MHPPESYKLHEQRLSNPESDPECQQLKQFVCSQLKLLQRIRYRLINHRQQL